MMTRRELGLLEMFGLSPPARRVREVAMMLRGDELTPKTRFGVSSLRILRPKLALQTWFGVRRPDRRVPMYNLFNHTQTPVEEGWSVRVTQVRDFRGGQQTYDSHNGTDFAVPVGIEVVAAAPGVVMRVSNEFHRGGIKVVIDHGRGLITTSNHLGRALVGEGDIVGRGDPVALTGASGVDLVAAFPWNVPHVHYNVWLDGEPVDPFARPGDASIWLQHNDPRPPIVADDERDLAETEESLESQWDPDAVDEAIGGCLDADLQRRLGAITSLEKRAVDTMFHLNYFPTRFSVRPMLYASKHEREPRLSLPFSADDFIGIALD